MKLRKLLAGLLAAVLACSLLAGCGAAGHEDEPSAAAGSSSTLILRA